MGECDVWISAAREGGPAQRERSLVGLSGRGALSGAIRCRICDHVYLRVRPRYLETFPGIRIGKGGPRLFSKDAGLLQGTVELLVLKRLYWGRMHGYGIASWIETATDDVLRVEEGGVGCGDVGRGHSGRIRSRKSKKNAIRGNPKKEGPARSSVRSLPDLAATRLRSSVRRSRFPERQCCRARGLHRGARAQGLPRDH